MTRKLKADRIFDGYRFVDNSILILNDEAMIESIVEDDGDLEVEKYDGILTPGFINCHCHLELSHMKGAISRHTGLTGFVREVMKGRFFKEEEIAASAEKYDAYMWQKGVVAVGDICNTADTIDVKKKSNIQYKNFIEVAGFVPADADKRLERLQLIYEKFIQEGLDAALVPHAPYSVSSKLFSLINAHSAAAVVSMHNQETETEDLFYKEKKGGFTDLYSHLKSDISFFSASGKSSLQTVLPYLYSVENLLLVHNTFTSDEDILFAESFAENNNINIYWVMCPNANLYIENKLPQLNLFVQHNCKIVFGTDSLSSNDDLDVLDELRTIKHYFPETNSEILLKGVCAEAASALGYHQLGKFEKGLQPGVNLIDNNLNFVKKIF